jgi:hypothetical protein
MLLTPLRNVVVRQVTVCGELQCPIERHPDRELRRCVVAVLVELPHPGVLVLPEDRDAVDAAREHLPGLLVERVPLRDVESRGLEQVAPRTELELRARRIPVPDGLRVAITAEVRQLLAALGDASVEVVEGPQVGRGLAHCTKEAGKRLLHLLGQAEPIRASRVNAQSRTQE